MAFWKTIEEEIFKNTQLDIYEKMCLLVLMSREEDEIHLSSEMLANYMGCGVVTARRAFDSLRFKGYFVKDYQKDPPVIRESAVLRGEEAVSEIVREVIEETETFQEGLFTVAPGSKKQVDASIESSVLIDPEKERRMRMAAYLLSPVEEPSKAFVSQKDSKGALVDELIEYIEEKISFKEANILLAFANNDIERIKREYKIAKMSQVSDTMGVLINALQKKPTNVIKTTESPEINQSQVDANRLRKMQAYRNGGSK